MLEMIGGLRDAHVLIGDMARDCPTAKFQTLCLTHIVILKA